MFKISRLLVVGVGLIAVGVNAADRPHLERPKLEPAKRDPFTAFAAPPPKTPKFKPQPVVATTAPAPMAAPLPTAPELGLFYAGQMTTPSGERRVFVMEQDQVITLKTGMTLANGFVVQAIEPRAVRFHYPATNSTARLNLPELPTFQSR